MLYLTDHPDHTRSLLPLGGEWGLMRVAELPPRDQALWRCLGSGDLLWQCEAKVSGPAPFDDDAARIVLIDDAPRSQFDAVTEAIHQGVDLPDRLACLALAGSGFRGQRDRQWQALRGNLHLTAHFRVSLPVAHGETGLTMLPAVAATQTVADLLAACPGAPRPGIKWVNDVLLAGRKVAGVLASTQVQGPTISQVVVGVGMNLRHRPQLVPSVLSPPPGALGEHLHNLHDLLPRASHLLLHYLNHGLRGLVDHGPQPLYCAYRSWSCFLGELVRIWPDPGEMDAVPLAAGRVRELRPDLSLVIDGLAEPIRKGRMQLVQEQQA
jgi:biotin-(acetyl-CoA carboxylase) ligase